MKINSIVTSEYHRCYVCHSERNLQVHHCMHGTANRKQAEKYGLTIPLCFKCHRELHDKNTQLDKHIMQLAQIEFEKNYSYELWMQVIGKNYR
ncbi:hypothetical protein [Sedimentibacter sp.]|uniref:hypothetical protein n=1 Tax=Sedimentibacter sp. TaxID=1960295 RepID=UPI0028B217B6|nr:hypothetical protein [Sedimentibacter sp.]